MTSWSQLAARVVLFTGLAPMILPACAHAQEGVRPKRVLVLYWYNKDYPGNVLLDRGFRTALRSSGRTVEYYPEYLETNRFPGEVQSQVLHDYLRRKYAELPIDVIVASGIAPLEFLLQRRNVLFPRTPIVSIGGLQGSAPTQTGGGGITGITLYNTYAQTLDLALTIHPETEQVFVVSGTLERDGRGEARVRQALQGYTGRARISYLTDLSPRELTVRMQSLPERSIVLHVWQQVHDERGRLLESADVLALLARTARAPIYGMSDALIGSGIVGGQVFTLESVGSQAAQLALRIAAGERAQDIPVRSANTVPMFDWRQLQRWGISESRLPTGSVVQFKEPSLWDLHKWRIIGVLSLCALQALLIVALLVQRHRRAQVEQALRREKQFSDSLMSEAIPHLVWTSLPDGSRDYCNQRWLDYTGLTMAEAGGFGWRNVIHPDDRERALAAYQASLAEGRDFEVEVRLRAADGSYRWFLSRSVPLRDLDGRIIKWYGTNTDIEDRKQAEDTLRDHDEALRRSHARIQDLAGRLITAQEEERKHVARELHDDLNQQVAALAINLSQLKHVFPDNAGPLREQVAKIQQRVQLLSEHIRNLSHELHSSTLQHVGLAAALTSYCEDFTDRAGVAVALNIQEGLGPVPTDVALCLYRVAQESLRNITKHSAAARAELELAATDGTIELRVVDHGVGFDPAQLQLRPGLGLISIEERVRLLRGTFMLRSAPGTGTELRVIVPLRNRGTETAVRNGGT